MLLLSKLLCVALSIAMLLQARAVKNAVGTWIYPACLYGLFWFAFSFFPVVLVPGTYSSPYAVGYILASCLAVSLGGSFVKFNRSYTTSPSFEEQDRLTFSSPKVQFIFASSAFFSLLCLLIDASIQGVSLNALMNDFFSVSSTFLVARYTDDLISNIFSQLATVLNYLTSFIGGLIYWAISDRAARWKKAAVILIAFVPSVFVLTVQAAKGTIFLSLALFVCGILLCRVRAKQDLPINWATVMIGIRYAAILFPFLLVSFISRGLYDARSMDELYFSLRRGFTSYALGHIYAFSDWFDYAIMGIPGYSYFRLDDITYGFYTFLSVFRTLGDDRYLPPGYFDEYYDDGLFVSTNIYTVFRGLITDFTLFGSLLFTAAISLFIHFTFKSVVSKYNSAFSIATFVLFCVFLASSYLISVLIWNSPYALFLAVVIFLLSSRGNVIFRRGIRDR